MEKILVVTHDLRNDNGALNFGCQISKLTASKLLTVAVGDETMELIASEDANLQENAALHRRKVSSEMEQKYRELGIEAEICEYNGDVEEALIFESRFTDLLILARDPSFLETIDHTPSSFVKRILAKAECPVVLAPKNATPIDEIAFCYDGSATSLHAIKQFTYLFPEHRNTKVVLLEVRNMDVSEGRESNWILHHARTRSWLEAHYSRTHFHFIQGSPSWELYNYFVNKKNVFIVMGAFGRTALSTLLKKSAAELVMRKIDLPLFIAHN